MNEVLFAVFLIGLGIAAAQTPSDQARQIDLKKECLCLSAARSAPVKIIGYPTLVPVRPIRIIPTLKKMENK